MSVKNLVLQLWLKHSQPIKIFDLSQDLQDCKIFDHKYLRKESINILVFCLELVIKER